MLTFKNAAKEGMIKIKYFALLFSYFSSQIWEKAFPRWTTKW